MKQRFYALAIFCLVGISYATAHHLYSLEPLKLTTPEMKPELVKLPENPFSYHESSLYDMRPETVSETSLLTEASDTQFGDFDFFKSKTNPDVKAYKVMDDLTFVGIPIFVAGIIAKSEKNSFRQDYNNPHSNTRLITNFKSSIDDYTQYFGPVATVGMKLAGYEGRSDWPRLLSSAAMSYGIMAALVNGIKYTASEMRPDGSTANSWPSGHTATSFVGATMLHKEYGLTRSPWFSVAGYGIATATGVMRILNNRHWISDVLSGAGIGIMSTELGYAIADVLFKKKGLLRNDLETTSDNPSYFSISMGLSLGTDHFDFPFSSAEGLEDSGINDVAFSVDFRTATSVDAEGVYFFNKYVGVGARLRVRAMTAKSWSDFVKEGEQDLKEMGEDISDIISWGSSIDSKTIQTKMADIVTDREFTVESDHLTEFSSSLGLYFNLPLSQRLSLGAKALIGRTFTQELDINAHFKGHVKDISYLMTINSGDVEELEFTSIDDNGVTYDEEWDYLTMGGNNSTAWGTGLSLTYRYKSNFAFKFFVDYDYSAKTFTLTYNSNRFLTVATPKLADMYSILGVEPDPIHFNIKKDVNYFTIGGSFAVTF